MGEVLIRLAEEKDVDSLAEMQGGFERYFQEIDKEFYDIDIESRKKDIYDLHFSNEAILKTLIAEQNGLAVGRVSFYRGFNASCPPIKVYHLSGIYVSKEIRGQRVAEKLFEELINFAKKENVKRIFWNVWGPNKSAAKFYERIGGRYYLEEDEHHMFMDVL